MFYCSMNLHDNKLFNQQNFIGSGEEMRKNLALLAAVINALLTIYIYIYKRLFLKLDKANQKQNEQHSKNSNKRNSFLW